MESHPKWLGRRVALLLAFLACPLLAEGVQAQSKSKVEIVSQIPHSMEVNTVAFSPEGSRVVSGSGDGTLKLWEAQSGRLIRTLEVHAAVAAVAFSLDGVRVLSGNWDNTVKLWDAATGELVRSFVGHSAYVHSVAFSPDGRHVVSGSSDKTLKLWESPAGSSSIPSRGIRTSYSQLRLRRIAPASFRGAGTRRSSCGTSRRANSCAP